MLKKLSPTAIYERLEDIPFELFDKLGIKGLILDVDNTLIDHRNILADEKLNWINEAKKRNIEMCILSNSYSEKKIRNLMKQLDINGLSSANKPFLKGFVFALDLLHLEKNEVCMIGDQIFTDILGANRFGIKSILVKPFDKDEKFWIKIKRPIEKILMGKNNK